MTTMTKYYKACCAALLLSIASFAQSAPIASGQIISGTTFGTTNAFQFTNNSTDGESIVRLIWDLSPIDGFFDSTDDNPGNSSTPLELDPGSSAVGHIFPTDADLNGSSVLDVLFTDFQVGETFIFGVDTDLFSAIDLIGIDGEDFVGAVVTVVFDNGAARTGTYVTSNIPGVGTEVFIDIPTTIDVNAPSTIGFMLLSMLGLAAFRRVAK